MMYVFAQQRQSLQHESIFALRCCFSLDRGKRITQPPKSNYWYKTFKPACNPPLRLTESPDFILKGEQDTWGGGTQEREGRGTGWVGRKDSKWGRWVL
eukprot:751002-Hanusia_phi.AAC.1